MTDKLPPLVKQPTAAPTRKLKAGMTAGVAVAVTVVPILFPAAMQVIEILSPDFAAEWGQTLAAVLSALLSVAGGSAVSYTVSNRATSNR